MKKSLYFLALSALIFSACNTLEIDKASTRTVKIGKVSVASSATKSGNDEVNTVYSSDEITIEEIATPLASYATKADEKTATTLSQFNLLGYYDASINNTVEGRDVVLNFMNTSASNETGEWILSDAGNWAHGAKHHFWAYSGAADDFAAEGDFSSASFDYSTDGSEDLLVAYTSQDWEGPDTHSVACGDNDEIKELQFHHALAQLNVVDNFVYKVDGEPNSARGSITSAKFSGIYDSGNCVVNDNIFSWTPKSHTTSVDCLSPSFVIPQETDFNVAVTVSDNLRKTHIDVPFKASISADWKEGYKYTYKLSGEVNFPSVEDPNFEGIQLICGDNKYHETLVGDIQANLIDSLDIQWTGLPQSNSSGTYFYLFFAQEGVEYDSKHLPNKDSEYVVFYYDPFDKIVIPADTHFGNQADNSSKVVSCTIPVPQSEKPLTLYVAFKGGNNSSQAKVALMDFTCKIHSFR